jgi:hypothetical protein
MLQQHSSNIGRVMIDEVMLYHCRKMREEQEEQREYPVMKNRPK